ncbi:MAG: mechanosensitive ion channel [Cyanobium sp. CZS 48M]|nr:mechanosensitive ion channel [Cyanobium sp. CZS48M]
MRSVGDQRLGSRAIPLESQPFHADLLKMSQRWREAPIGQVVGESPRDTLLNFYVVMAKVYDILEELVAEPAQQPGLFWSAETLERAQDANDSLQEAISALDVQSLPRSIRDDLAMESALKLKKLLDYSFIHAREPFDIPAVRAFSAVPGLAIGLGASKLLGNLFAGLSIQTDRPLKVGEFCQIGEHEGFITKIGLRSLELNTVESRVTIPNSLVDEQKVVNYSVRSGDPEEPLLQGLDLRLVTDQPLVPFQIRELFRLVNRAMRDNPDLIHPLASLDPSADEGLVFTFHARVEASDWPRYLETRQHFMIRLRQLVAQVNQCYLHFGVAYDTSSAILGVIPGIVAEIFSTEPLSRLCACRLLRINEFSLDFYGEYESDQPSLALFEEAHARLLCALIDTLRLRGIEIPIPTAIEIEKVPLSLSASAPSPP